MKKNPVNIWIFSPGVVSLSVYIFINYFIMENEFNYHAVPHNYAHCFNHQCVKSNTCLRHLVATHCTSAQPTIYIVNPVWIPEDTSTCTQFRPIQKIRMAWGVQSLLNNVPYKDARALKSQIISYFGKTHYYRIYRKEYGLTPNQQEFIRRVFRHKGISEEPAFESYTEVYQWS